MKNILKKFLPYGILALYRKLRYRPAVRYLGNYPDWNAAARVCRGYDAADILERVRKAVLEVLAGHAVFERDSVLFNHEEPNHPLLNAMLFAGHNRTHLRILDYGGGLGSVYFQNRKFLSCFKQISWRIVEQPHFVAAGLELFREHPSLSFYNSLEEAVKDWMPDLVLFSSVLQYLPDFQAVLHRAQACGCRYIFIDRCLCFKQETASHRYCAQQVSEAIYPASYPVQIFNRRELLEPLAAEYDLLDEFLSYPDEIHLEKPSATALYQGWFLQRRNLPASVEMQSKTQVGRVS